MKPDGWRVFRISLACVATASAVAAISPEDKCEADKNKIAGKYAFCRLKAEAKAIKKGELPDYGKCDEKLLGKWAKAEQGAINKGTSCIDSVTDADIQSFSTAYANNVAAALGGNPLLTCPFPASGQTTAYGADSDGDVQAGAPLSYTDNGDGTITDNNTGLMWEKKSNDGSIHDRLNTYLWCGASCNGTNIMDGPIATFLATLNSAGGFAGYTDWRIPNVKELLSIVSYETFNYGIDPAFNTNCVPGCTVITCSCTGGNAHASSTTSPSNSYQVYVVGFGLTPGLVTASGKQGNYNVRAVRGGF